MVGFSDFATGAELVAQLLAKAKYSGSFDDAGRRATKLGAKTAGSSHGPWRLADSPGLHIALPNAYFDSLGIPRLTVR